MQKRNAEQQRRDDIIGSRRRRLRWWLRPVPLLVGGLGLSLIAAGLLGAGGTESDSAEESRTTRIEVPIPGTEAADAATEAAIPADSATVLGAGGSVEPIDPPPPITADAEGGTARSSADDTGEAQPSAQDPSASVAAAVPPQPAGDAAATEAAETSDETAPHEGPGWESITVRSGDSLAAIFDRAGLGAGELHRLINADERTSELERIYPDDVIRFRVEDDRLLGLRYPVDQTETLVVTREEDGFRVSMESKAVETRVEHASGTVNRSLFLAGLEAGLSHGQIMRLMGIFEWQVDFAREVRSGDSFSVAYESYYVDGEHVRDGPILAARYVNRGRQIDAVRYTDPDGNTGYYNPQGENLRKAFLRRPVQNARISSHYNPNRKHPVLGVRRPHLGTDFAAPPGTPVRASGNGRVVHVGRKGGYGRAVIIEHANRYRTLYAHMSRYASGIDVGTRVEQGQTIGYVGASGLVTGAHLHYEFIENGVHRNPMRVELPNGDPVAEAHMQDFRSQAEPLVAQLDDMSDGEQQLAMRDNEGE
ncbi:peptidoglycan DD-metalloendopeptidase family protein [Aquisalimonas lutea]|uniref:OapA family protein n=1 Tax=Aquisalimonas lutea TaxID=1327750 RepID=UPI0025B3204C|nr:peptidoglycan DD-metalloendopeptidase family protein [Aquisalimonas lutea]MDN3516956.1 peptidoglycan DD-metalloendopeptidase family protein [Aquisalimonas lutea]